MVSKMGKRADLTKLSPKQLHGIGSGVREKDQDIEALKYLDQTMVGYQKKANCKTNKKPLKVKTLQVHFKNLLALTNLPCIYNFLANNAINSNDHK
jgi:hypothetical protein